MANPAFIFDLDGVITDTAEYHYRAWKRLATSLDIDFTHDDNEALKGVGRRESLEYILAKDDNHYSEERITALMHQKNEDYVASIADMSPKDTLPGVNHLLQTLRNNGHKIGLASASKNALMVLDSLELTHMFDYVADAATIPNSKPAPDVFLDVVNAFDTTSDQCIGVEDAAAGVQAIKSAKMFAVGIGDDTVLAQADMVYPAFADIVLDDVLTRWKAA